MPKLPKYNGTRLFHKLAQEVKKDFIERNGRKPTIPEWNVIQKFTSKEVFPKFKHQSHEKIDFPEVQKYIKFIKEPKEVRKCGNVFYVNQAIYEFVPWWDIFNIIERLPNDIQIRLNAGEHGITKLDSVFTFEYYQDIKDIYEKLRIEANNDSDGNLFFEGIIKVVPGGKDDGKECSYFIDFVLNDDAGRVDDDEDLKIVNQMPVEDKERLIREKEAQAKKKRAESEKIQKAKDRKRPSKTKEQAEAIAAKAKEAEETKYSDNKIKSLQLMKDSLELLRKDFESGIYDKKEYKEERAKLMNKFEDGGTI